MTFDPTTEKNINGLKKLNLDEIEELCCCFRGMEMSVRSLEGHVDKSAQNICESLKRFATDQPEHLPSALQVIEWELGRIVRSTATLLKDAGIAIDKCHAIRGGNQTVVSLLQLRADNAKNLA